MTFKHKLARRLALLRDRFAVTVLLTGVVLGCERPVAITSPNGNTTSQVAVSPRSLTLWQNQITNFTAVALTTTGDTAIVAVTWSVTSGAMLDTSTSGGRHYGRYKAGAPLGQYKVIATGHPNSTSDTALVTVAVAPVATVLVNPAAASVLAGQTVQLAVVTEDAAGDTLSGRSIAWSSSNTAAATVNGSGLVTGVAGGSTTITATSEGQSGQASITVSTIAVASVTVSPVTASVQQGATVQLTATPKDGNGNPLIGRTVTWASNGTSVATVNGSGLVTGVGAGSATITATSEGKSGTSSVTVTSASVASVTVSPTSANVGVGTTVQLTATLKDSAGNVLTGRAVTWTSSASGVATVSGSGLVTGVAAGTATITATSGGKSGAAVVTVTASSGSPITDPWAVLTEPTLPQPAALTPIYPTPFNLKVMRIVGDPGSTFTMATGGSGTWGSDARHHYSDDQPWNADGTLLMLQNSGSPGDVILDGQTYQALQAGCSDGGFGRWLPTLAHRYERLSNKGGTLFWYDIRTCSTTRSWTLPFSATGDIEMGGSFDGRFIALSEGARVSVVDMDPQAPFAPYPSQRVGPVFDFSNCGVSSGCTLDWTQVSASGRYVIVHFEGDWQQVLDVDPNTLALTPRPMPAAAYRCHGTAAQGFIEDLGHPDVTLNPFDNNEDVVIGQEHCGIIGQTVNGLLIGGVMMVRLRDGAITPLTNPTNEAYPYHISTRDLDRPGWVYVGYWPSPGQRFDDELVAVKLDGSGAVERYAHTHSNSSGCYRCEPHGVPARDGRRILWASTWTINGTGGTSSVTQAYVVDAR